MAVATRATPIILLINSVLFAMGAVGLALVVCDRRSVESVSFHADVVLLRPPQVATAAAVAAAKNLAQDGATTRAQTHPIYEGGGADHADHSSGAYGEGEEVGETSVESELSPLAKSLSLHVALATPKFSVDLFSSEVEGRILATSAEDVDSSLVLQQRTGAIYLLVAIGCLATASTFLAAALAQPLRWEVNECTFVEDDDDNPMRSPAGPQAHTGENVPLFAHPTARQLRWDDSDYSDGSVCSAEFHTSEDSSTVAYGEELTCLEKVQKFVTTELPSCHSLRGRTLIFGCVCWIMCTAAVCSAAGLTDVYITVRQVDPHSLPAESLARPLASTGNLGPVVSTTSFVRQVRTTRARLASEAQNSQSALSATLPTALSMTLWGPGFARSSLVLLATGAVALALAIVCLSVSFAADAPHPIRSRLKYSWRAQPEGCLSMAAFLCAFLQLPCPIAVLSTSSYASPTDTGLLLLPLSAMQIAGAVLAATASWTSGPLVTALAGPLADHNWVGRAIFFCFTGAAQLVTAELLCSLSPAWTVGAVGGGVVSVLLGLAYLGRAVVRRELAGNQRHRRLRGGDAIGQFEESSVGLH